MRKWAWAAAVLAGAGCALSGSGEGPIPTQLGMQTMAVGLSFPVQYAAHPTNPSLAYVAERLGLIRLMVNDVLSPMPVVDLSGLLASGAQQGVLALALDPEAGTNRHLYVAFTAEPLTTVRVVRLTLSPDGRTADLGSLRPILTVAQAADSTHKAGAIRFDDQGMMRIAMGDGTLANDTENNAQTAGNLSGKILRIDPRVDDFPADPDQNYGIPTDNPFRGSAGFRPEIWAMGVRNPFRWTYDMTTGASIIADVGQEQREELNFEPAGAGGRNYGWAQREGRIATTHPGAPRPEPKSEPFLDWGRSDGRSVIGGFVYRGVRLGGSGSYLFGDFSFGHVRSVRIRLNGSGEAQAMEIGETVLHTLPEKLNGLTAIEPDHAGEPVLVEMFAGRVSRLVLP